MITDKSFRLDGKVALITGASYGIGFAIASAYASMGATIVFNDINEELMNKGLAAYKEAGITAHGYVCDVTDEAAVAAFIAKVEQEVGTVDILVNNAGIIKLSPAENHTMEDFDAVMEVNLRSLFLLTREIARQMISLGHGKIINTCSVQSMKGGSGDAAYVASKHAVHGLTRAWANEWGRYNIQVNGIAPGYMVTDNTAKLRQNREAVAAITAQIPLGRWGKPEDLMGPVVFLASNASNFVNGHLLVADGGYLNA